MYDNTSFLLRIKSTVLLPHIPSPASHKRPKKEEKKKRLMRAYLNHAKKKKLSEKAIVLQVVQVISVSASVQLRE